MRADPKDGEKWEYWWTEWRDKLWQPEDWRVLTNPAGTVMAMKTGRWSVIAESDRYVLSYNDSMSRLLFVRRVS